MVGRVLSAFAPFEVALTETARFPGLLYLRPEPVEPFLALTEALVAALPEFPPYAGEFDEIVPHVTVAQADQEVLVCIEREIDARLPLSARVEHVWLLENAPEGWRRHTAFPLDRRTSI